MRMNIKGYLLSHSEKDLDEYHFYLDQMNQHLDEATVEIQQTGLNGHAVSCSQQCPSIDPAQA